MKVALFIDQLVEKDSLTEFANVLIPAFKDVEIFTLAHRPGAVGGNLEQFRIRSTYLSHMVKNKKELLGKSFLAAKALSGLNIPCSFDLVFVLTEGLCGGLNFCEKTKCYTYVMSLNALKPSSFLSKIFSAYITKKCHDVLVSSHQLFFSHQELLSFFENRLAPKPMQVLPPIFPYGDYPLIEESIESKNIVFLLNKKENFDSTYLKLLADQSIFATGPFVKEGEEDDLWKRSNCLRSWYQLMLQTKLVVSFNDDYFPWQELRALACGIPVIRVSNLTTPFLKSDKVLQLKSKEELITNIQALKTESRRDRLRDEAVKFNEIRFKSFLKQNIPEIYS
jgi:hypothetical protein